MKNVCFQYKNDISKPWKLHFLTIIFFLRPPETVAHESIKRQTFKWAKNSFYQAKLMLSCINGEVDKLASVARSGAFCSDESMFGVFAKNEKMFRKHKMKRWDALRCFKFKQRLLPHTDGTRSPR